jgi:hypothetical protein
MQVVVADEGRPVHRLDYRLNVSEWTQHVEPNGLDTEVTLFAKGINVRSLVTPC